MVSPRIFACRLTFKHLGCLCRSSPLLKPRSLNRATAEQGLDGDRLELPGAGQRLSIESAQLAERRTLRPGAGRIARPSPGRAPNRDFSFPAT